MKRWVGLGVIADNLVNLGRALAKPPDAKRRHADNTAPARRRSRRQNSDEDAVVASKAAP